ncbi:MAG TPA: outer membrane protein assembly factor BamD [Spirochaetota bacterium]|nr:outer membrane protein assembly factor BamD [Spirochaetota bacterium]
MSLKKILFVLIILPVWAAADQKEDLTAIVEAWKVKDYEEVTELATDFITDYPNSSKLGTIYFMNGTAYFKTGAYKKAHKYLTTMLNNYGDSKYAGKAEQILAVVKKKISLTQPQKKKEAESEQEQIPAEESKTEAKETEAEDNKTVVKQQEKEKQEEEAVSRPEQRAASASGFRSFIRPIVTGTLTLGSGIAFTAAGFAVEKDADARYKEANAAYAAANYSLAFSNYNETGQLDERAANFKTAGLITLITGGILTALDFTLFRKLAQQNSRLTRIHQRLKPVMVWNDKQKGLELSLLF